MYYKVIKMGVVKSENEGKAMDASEEFSSNRSYAEVDSHSSSMVPIERVTVLWYISPIFDTEVR